ncbi:hypothetical protein BT63DRAFT_308258 [Microthyrium microscopicum]|uniref:Uncharacterized protein n=1 Tax=Microthyrium microscopicum TaxID=703497 RepID=A0A6A6U7D0_9PEZI|nr:hypothetical protein BT63DRAFT_308258 [Microthyrium microscopicum]
MLMSHPAPLNGGLGGPGSTDASGTINPAALNNPGQLGSSNALSQQSPRGIKRSRSRTPDNYDHLGVQYDEDDKPRKRGRPPKAVKLSGSPVTQPLQTATPQSAPPVQTPQSSHQIQTQASPSLASPSKTPTKTPVLKALPTVRDHTSNELNEQGDEYLPREIDEAGEKKVAPNGAPLEGRQYKCRTFYMPDRGDKLFMLATECAKVLNYRDSYLLFNKNRSLYKIIANQPEKNELIHQDILPSSYRSRQIAIVTARSMYRQFGSRLIVNGRRVRDDYWESKARKQGFTEDDPAGEKRPGAAKAREAAAAAQAESNAAALAALPQGPVIYSTSSGSQIAHGQLPMIQPIPEHELGDYSSVPRPRHDITGPAYVDRTQPSSATEIMTQATQAAEYNKQLATQRRDRANYLNNIWRTPHPPASQAQPGEDETSNAQRSPQQSVAGPSSSANQAMGSLNPQSRHPMMAAPPSAYSQQPVHHSMLAQSPNRPAQQQLPGQHRSPTMPMGLTNYAQPQQYYPQPMWTSSQTQPSQLVQAPMQYGGPTIQSPPPHMQPSAVHPGMSVGGMGGNMPGMAGGMGYNAVPGGMNPPGYAGVPRQMYQPQQQQQGQNSPHYMQQQQTNQGWPQGQAHPGPQQQHWNSNYHQ